MDSKLQQAIVATRAGYTETAQILLTDILQEDPEQIEAWFLLAHLVESPERQARYLNYVLALEPEHELARRHLRRLQTPEVPPPVIKASRPQESTSTHAAPPATRDSKFSALPPAKIAPIAPTMGADNIDYEKPQTGSHQVVVEQSSSRIDTAWQNVAGMPKRATQPTVSAPVQEPPPPAKTAGPATPTKQPANKWLVAILIILLALAFFVVSFLAFTVFFQ